MAIPPEKQDSGAKPAAAKTFEPWKQKALPNTPMAQKLQQNGAPGAPFKGYSEEPYQAAKPVSNEFSTLNAEYRKLLPQVIQVLKATAQDHGDPKIAAELESMGYTVGGNGSPTIEALLRIVETGGNEESAAAARIWIESTRTKLRAYRETHPSDAKTLDAAGGIDKTPRIGPPTRALNYVPGDGPTSIPLQVQPVLPQTHRHKPLGQPIPMTAATPAPHAHPAAPQMPAQPTGSTYPTHAQSTGHAAKPHQAAAEPPAISSSGEAAGPAPGPIVRPVLRKPITPAAAPVGEPTVCKGPDGKTVTVSHTSNGRVQIECPPAPLQEITFAGGGGKGNVYPGVVDALENDGALAEAKELHGASAGSITAALLASGMTADEFKKFSDGHNFMDTIGQDAPHKIPKLNIPIGSEGRALEDLVSNAMRDTLTKKIDAYLKTDGGKPKDPAITDIAARLKSGKGPTFKDLHLLSSEIPAIKDVVIDATKNTDDPNRPMESVILSVDNSPDMNVAEAVHASAALPGVFKSKNLTTADHQSAPYRDGGILNNAPSTDTIGNKRDVDPVASTRSMTFVFEDEESKEMLKGRVRPMQVGTFNDAEMGASGIEDAADIVGGPIVAGMSAYADYKKKQLAKQYGMKGVEYAAGQYDTNKILSQHRDAVVAVPLTYQDKGKQIDDSDTRHGTLNFDMSNPDKTMLRRKAYYNTDTDIKEKQQPRKLTFDSLEQALNTVPRDVLARMATTMPEAKETMAFRETVEPQIGRLEKIASSGPAPDMVAAQAIIDNLSKLTQGYAERASYLGREMNRSGKLDALFALVRKTKKGQWFGNSVVDAGLAINDQLEIEAMGREVDKKAVIPLMVTTAKTPAGLAEMEMLMASDERLRHVKSYKVIRDALAPAARFYAGWVKGATDRVDRGPFIKTLSAAFHKAAQSAEAEH